jgi:hypothetical protein
MTKRALHIWLRARPPVWLFLVFFSAGAAGHAQTDPASLPAHDAHEGLLVAANPYTSDEQSKIKFGKHTPFGAGILAIDVYFRNDNDLPIRLNLRTVEMRIGAPNESRQRLPAISPEDVADEALLKTKSPKDPRQPRIRGPLPGAVPKSGRGKEWDDFDGLLRSVSMATEVIPPHGTAHGFFFFNIANHFDWLSNASFDVSDLQFMTNKKALLFFEVDLAPVTH